MKKHQLFPYWGKNVRIFVILLFLNVLKLEAQVQPSPITLPAVSYVPFFDNIVPPGSPTIGSTNIFYNFNGGNPLIGIGTITPSYALDISGSNNSILTLLRLQNTFAPTPNTGSSILFSSNYMNVGTPILTDIASISSIALDPNYPSYKGGMIFSTANGATPDEKMRIDQLGHIGIGTQSPSQLLHINATGSTVSCAAMTNGANTSGLLVGLDASGNAVYKQQSSSLPMMFYTNGNERMRINSGGNIGIGTSSPSYLLDLSASASGSAPTMLRLQNTSSSAWNNGCTIMFSAKNSGSSIYDVAGIAGIEANPLFSNLGTLVFYTANGSTPAERMRIDNGGNVGIGTNSPGQLLDINGGSSQVFMRIANTANANGLVIGLNSSSDATFNQKDAHNMTFSTSNTERMRISSLGGVSIGTTTTSGVLHVVASGSQSSAYSGTLIENTATSGTSAIIKSGLEVSSNGSSSSWNGPNIGIYVSSVTGGSSNYDAVFNGGGNVGIGTNTPGSALYIGGSRVSTGNGQTAGLTVATTFTGNTGIGAVSDYINGAKISPALIAGANSQNLVGLYVAPSYSDNSNSYVNHYDAIFNGGGYVGFAQNQPRSLVDIGGTLSATYNGQVAGLNLSTTLTGRSSASGDNLYSVQIAPTFNAGSSSQNMTALYVAPTYNNASQTGINHYDAVFNGGGYVGIGTAQPQELLHLNVNVDNTRALMKVTNYHNSSGLLFGLDGTGNAVFDQEDNSKPIIVKTNAAERMRILSDGKIGINTATPAELLDLNGAFRLEDVSSAPSATTNRLYSLGGTLYWNGNSLSGTVTSGSGNTGFVPYYNSGSTMTNSILKFNNTSQAFQAFNLPGTGLSYPSPIARMETDEQGYGLISYNRSCSQANPDPGTPQIYSYSVSNLRADIHLFPSAITGNCSIAIPSGTPVPQPGLAFTMTDHNSPKHMNDALFIKETSWIGVGNNDPQAQLHVWIDNNSALHGGLPTIGQGEILVGSTTYGDHDNGTIKTFGETNGYYFADQGWGGGGTAAAGNYFKLYASGSEAHLWTPTTADIITFKNDGKVGIGIDPSHSLQISGDLAVSDPSHSNTINFLVNSTGNVHCRSIDVDNTTIPDYVFDKDYKLMSLEQLEEFTNTQKHLPGIPSAQEYAERGKISLNELQLKLLEKVEELTRYVIELKKENEEMKKEISSK